MTKEMGGSNSATTAVQVALRIRPLTERDKNQPRFANLASDDVLKIHDKTVQVVPQNKLFTFDYVFGTTSTQEEIFASLADNLIRKFIEGYNITILAYGQTSSGKTYTMGTASNTNASSEDDGIVPRSMALLFDLLHNNNDNRPISPTSSISSSTSASTKSASRIRPKSRIANRSSHIPHVNQSHKTRFTVKVSFIEIYNEDLHDLLNSAPTDELPPITIREDTKGRIYWTGVKEMPVHSTDDVLYYLEQGTQNRATGATDMNEKSSRSHAIFSVSLKQEKWMPSETRKPRPASSMSMRSSLSNSRLSAAASNQQEDGEWLITTSKFNFVDLAGSERLKRTAAEGDRRKEGININAGLLALGNVISALGDPSKKNVHVPYRDSKLTRLLQDSLGGSATTLMIACASPVEYNLAETLNTLQYANRARNIKNRSEKNQVEEWMTTENIELLRSLIGKLKNELNYIKLHSKSSTHHLQGEDMFDDVSTSSSSTSPSSSEELYHEQRLIISDLQRQVEELDGEASVTRERNRIVEKELQRVRLSASMMQSKEEQVDFQHLVEPVIEEYEKSIAKLESQLALTKAALNHSDMGYEEQQKKLTQMEGLIRTQEQTIGELRLRLSKLLEREQNNDSYIHELETKLMKSANEANKDQEMLQELKNRIMKFKETDENTEQYISNLEQRLAAGEAERIRLQGLLENLESKVEDKERTNVELLKRLSKSTSDTSTEKLMLKELDQANSKCAELEAERDSLKHQILLLKKDSHRVSSVSNSSETYQSEHGNADSLQDELKGRRLSNALATSGNSRAPKNRKSLADETETAASINALNLLQIEMRLKEETERANHLQETLDHLQHDHSETVKELDEVLQRYHETLEQLEFLEQESSSSVTLDEKHPQQQPEQVRQSLDLSKEIEQAKEDAFEQQKQSFLNQIADLQHRISSLDKKVAIKDSELDIAKDKIGKLEQELAIANKQINILRQMESEHKATAEVEHILEELDVPEDRSPRADQQYKQDDLVNLLASEKKQVSHWKLAHSELQRDMEKLALDLDGKEQYIAQLERKLEDEGNQKELQYELEESNQHASNLQKRLAETLASLTVLKISHDSLQKKLREEQAQNERSRDTIQDEQEVSQKNTISALEKEVARHNQEKTELLKKHQSELAVIQHNTDTKLEDINKLLQETMLDKDTTLQKLLQVEQQIRNQAESLHNSHYLEQEKMLETHNKEIMELTSQKSKLEEELGSTKDTLSRFVKEEDDRMKETTAENQQVSRLEHELKACRETQEQLVLQHDKEILEISKSFENEIQELEEQISEISSELEASKDLHKEILLEHKERLQQAIANTRNEEQEKVKAVQDSLQLQIQDLRCQLNDYAEVKLQHQQLQQTLEMQVESLKNELEDLRASHDTQLMQLGKEHDAQLDSQISQGQTLLEQAQTELGKYKAENENLVVALQEQKEASLALQSKLVSAPSSTTSDRVAERIATLESQLKANKTETDRALTREGPLKKQADLLQAQLEQEQHKSTGLLQKVATLESELATAIAHQSTIVTELEARHQKELLEQHNENKADVDKHSGEKEASEQVTGEHMSSRVPELTQDVEDLRQADKELIKTLSEEITKLEHQMQLIREENQEYTSLSEELEKEINRITQDKEAAVEDLESSEEAVHMLQDKIDQLQTLLGTTNLVSKVKELMEERSAMSTKLALLTEAQKASSDNSNGTLHKKDLDGSGAISKHQGPSMEDLKQELESCHLQIESMVTREEMTNRLASLEEQQKSLLESEKQKLERSERARQKLEKQLEELLSKKSPFKCF